MVAGRAKTAHGIYASALHMTRKVQKKYLKYVPETIRSGSFTSKIYRLLYIKLTIQKTLKC
jgi:hypothetical protein